ncbi:hypothetical protein NUW54_g4444 [Trametes sanguinea]|uniref:Uncharacterized protein n=1 Tax=Trametes sanguinea TaxID=158606 RepID=A0ACC1PYZ8_9APHY|nr:hypothetical protein NUW54_g4444 [Trametes sanguinea]
MPFIETTERVVQDSANMATTSGVSVATVIQHFRPDVLVEQGTAKLIAIGDLLMKSYLPKDEEARYFKRRNNLFADAQALLEAMAESRWFKQVTLIPQAHSFNSRASRLYISVQLSTEFWRSQRYREFARSTQTLDGWETVEPPSPRIGPANADTDATCGMQQVALRPRDGQEDDDLESIELHAPSGSYERVAVTGDDPADRADRRHASWVLVPSYALADH